MTLYWTVVWDKRQMSINRCFLLHSLLWKAVATNWVMLAFCIIFVPTLHSYKVSQVTASRHEGARHGEELVFETLAKEKKSDALTYSNL